MPMINGEHVEHVIYDCNERKLLFEDVYLQLIPVTNSNWDALKRDVCPGQNLHKPSTTEDCIGVFCVEENGTFIPNGCILVEDQGIFYVIKGLNPERLSFIEKDADGRIKIVR